MDTPDASREWIDRLAIADLGVRFSDAVTRGDLDAFEALWVPDGVWEESAPLNLRIVGAAVIRAHVASMDTIDFFVQMTHGAVVTLHGEDRASARTTVQSFARAKDAGFKNLGIYYDDLVKVDGRWKFARRRLENIYIETEPLTGTLATARSDIP